MGRPAWLPAVIFDSCKNLLSAVLTVSIILRSASLCIKRIGLYYYFYWPTYIGYVYKSMHAYIYTYIYTCHTYIHAYTHIHKYLCLIIRSWPRDLTTKVLVLVSRPGTKVLVLVSRPGGQGLGLGLETWWPRSWSWSRDQVTKVLVLVSSSSRRSW